MLLSDRSPTRIHSFRKALMTRERFFSITARLLLLAAPFAVGAIILSDSALPWTRLLTLLATEETMRADAGFAFVVRALQIAFFFMARLAGDYCLAAP